MPVSLCASLVGDIVKEIRGFCPGTDLHAFNYVDLAKANVNDLDGFGFDPSPRPQQFLPEQENLAATFAQFLWDREKNKSIYPSPLTRLQSTNWDTNASLEIPSKELTVCDSFMSESSSSSYSHQWQGDLESTTSQEQVSKQVSGNSYSKGKKPSEAPKGILKKHSKKPQKRNRNVRKLAIAALDDAGHIQKRRESLEKNRIAASKSRAKKKDQTEQMQQESQENAIHNATLRKQVMLMKKEIFELTTILFAHMSGDGCKSPKDIQKRLMSFANEYNASPENISPVVMDEGDEDFVSLSQTMSYQSEDEVNHAEPSCSLHGGLENSNPLSPERFAKLSSQQIVAPCSHAQEVDQCFECTIDRLFLNEPFRSGLSTMAADTTEESIFEPIISGHHSMISA